MKYFTSEWRTGEMSDQESEHGAREYWYHLARIAPRLPSNVHKLATEINLHDGLVVQFRLTKGASEFQIRLVCGDLQVGYFDLSIRYIDANLRQKDVAAIEDVAANPESEVLYDEIDIDDDGYVHHNISFHPKGEIEVVFRDVKIVKAKLPNRNIPKVDAPFVKD